VTIAQTSEGHRFRLEPWVCPICGPAAGKETLGVRGGPRHRYAAGVETPIVRCRSCRLLFPDPFPVPLEDGEPIYGDPERYFSGDVAGRLGGYRSLVADLQRRCRASEPALLDVGSGRGELLFAAQEAGMRAVGLELSPAFADAARRELGVDVRLETVEEHATRVDAPIYDIVTLAAVIEHVHDPDATMAAIARVAKPGALLYVDVPTEPNLLTWVGNAVERVRGRRAVYNLSPTFPPYHVYGFSLNPLRRLLAKHGFVIEARRVWAAPRIRSSGAPADAVAAFAATQVNRLANLTRTASNQFVWARKA
jgi:SAM-dependent methyltransferase